MPYCDETKRRVERAIEDIRQGKFVVVADDIDRENEGDLVAAASLQTADSMAFMVRHTSGVICVPMLEERLDQLKLPQMVLDNRDRHRTAFTISVDATENTTTGISAQDRAVTTRLLADPHADSLDFRRPGHIFPLRYTKGGVLKRAGHTEATLDLVRLAGLYPAGVLAEIVRDDGAMARRGDLRTFADAHQLTMITIADLIQYRRHEEKLVEEICQTKLPTRYGDFRAHVYRSELDNHEHIALVLGTPHPDTATLVRVHSECLTGDALGSLRCDCRTQLERALELIGERGEGVLVYLRGHEGRGIGLGHKLRAYALQDQGLDTVDANVELGLPVDSREYGIGAQILADIGVRKMALLTNNPAKYGGLEGYDLEIVERVPLVCQANEHNAHYLATKREKMGHLLDEMNTAKEETHASV